MIPQYEELRSEFRGVRALEKVASTDEQDLSTSAQCKLAEACDSLYERVKVCATQQMISEDLPRKEAAALSVVDFMFAVRDSHQVTGVKLAASKEDVLRYAQKLATAVFVDEVLSEQLTKLSGEALAQSREVQLLGREYAVTLMQGLLT